MLAPDNTFYLVNSESIGADSNYFFKCRDDVCVDACLFCCKCNVDAACLFKFGVNFASDMCEFFTTDDDFEAVASETFTCEADFDAVIVKHD